LVSFGNTTFVVIDNVSDALRVFIFYFFVKLRFLRQYYACINVFWKLKEKIANV
jgi:hypothetical protein